VLVEGHVGGHGRGVGVVALGGEELLEGVFYALSALYQFTCMTKTRTVYSPLVWPVVTEPLGRPVAPVAALDSTGTRKVPTTLAWRMCAGTISAIGPLVWKRRRSWTWRAASRPRNACVWSPCFLLM
jgi:hypothetical protein